MTLAAVYAFLAVLTIQQELEFHTKRILMVLILVSVFVFNLARRKTLIYTILL